MGVALQYGQYVRLVRRWSAVVEQKAEVTLVVGRNHASHSFLAATNLLALT